MLGLLLALLILTNLQLPFTIRIKEALGDGFIPFLEFSSRTQGSLEFLVHRFKGYTDLQAENTELGKRVSELSLRVAEFGELEHKSRRLEAMLDFKVRSQLKLVSARVIGHDPSNWWKAVLVDRGSLDGIRRDMPVLTVEGLVGKIIDVREHDAQVLLIVDENCRVSGWMSKSALYGIVHGNIQAGNAGSQCKMTIFDRRAGVKMNDLVFTSGLGEISGVGAIFPKGIPIGTVSSVLPISQDLSKGALYKEVGISLAVDLSGLDEVFIDVGTSLSHDMKPSEKTKPSGTPGKS